MFFSVFCHQSVFDALVGDEFLKARTRANPYEFIRGAIFQNRLRKLLKLIPFVVVLLQLSSLLILVIKLIYECTHSQGSYENG